ncbi:hypothetical protein ASA1KI_38680 [Opitutales bacterium ASA1]|uniref:hypothetical protein n=1 Tax=Congregicoccus parvus TaxID=3081749 RepID=UPI002B2E4100|nr:hypothetical protein ASA1KI_38680 [Opitutales bacterium ASA1]
MARELSSDPPSSLNPLCFSGTAMHPQVLLAVKLMLVVLLSGGLWRPLDGSAATLFADTPTWLRAFATLGWLHTLLVVTAATALLLNRFVRTAAVVLGLLTLGALATDVARFSPHLALGGILSVAAGLQPEGGRPWLVRTITSFSLLLISAALALTPGWLGGGVAGSWIHLGVAHVAAAGAASLFGDPFWTLFAWLLPTGGFAVAVALLVPGTRTAAAIVLAGGSLFTSFTIALPQAHALAITVGVAALTFIDWPKGPVVVLWPRACGVPMWVRIALDRYDFDGRLDWPLPPDPDAILEVTLERRHYVESRALAALLLRFPVFLVVAFATAWCSHVLLPVQVAPLAYVLAAAPLLTLVAMRRLKHAGRRIQRRVVGQGRT